MDDKMDLCLIAPRDSNGFWLCCLLSLFWLWDLAPCIEMPRGQINMKSSLIQALDVTFVSKILNPGVILFFSLFFPFPLFALQHRKHSWGRCFLPVQITFPHPFCYVGADAVFIYLKSSTSYHKKHWKGEGTEGVVVEKRGKKRSERENEMSNCLHKCPVHSWHSVKCSELPGVMYAVHLSSFDGTANLSRWGFSAAPRTFRPFLPLNFPPDHPKPLKYFQLKIPSSPAGSSAF